MAHSHKFTKDLETARKVSPYKRNKFRADYSFED